MAEGSVFTLRNGRIRSGGWSMNSLEMGLCLVLVGPPNPWGRLEESRSWGRYGGRPRRVSALAESQRPGMAGQLRLPAAVPTGKLGDPTERLCYPEP